MITETGQINFTEVKLEDPFKSQRRDIEDFWKTYHTNNPDSYSEKVLNVFGLVKEDNNYTLSIGWINFYESLYSKLTERIKTRTLFCAGFMITSDGYYCLAVDNNDHINLIGGVSSLKDVKDGWFIPDHCLIRECEEEIGVDIYQDGFDYSLKYIKIPKEDEIYSPIGLIYEIKTDQTKNELETVFLNTPHDNEIKSLKFFDSNEKDLFGKNKRRPYINELFELIF